jgi:N-acetylglucosamine-6-phosphate deacetylase
MSGPETGHSCEGLILMLPESIMPQAPFAIHAARVFDGNSLLGHRRIEIANGRITAVLDAGYERETASVIQLADDVTLSPGLIDLQVNGGGGVMLNDAPTLATICQISAAHRRFGTTGILPTLITDEAAKTGQLAGIAQSAAGLPGILGFHLEGPFINPARKGIHPLQHIRQVTAQDIGMLARFAGAGRSLITLAPECAGTAMVAQLAALGQRISAGHSDANAAQVLAAADQGLSGVTHLFNAMSQMSVRAPGLVGAALADERLFAGIICDGHHVDPLNLRVAYRAKGRERLMLVSDAMSSVGVRSSVGAVQPDFDLHGRHITLKDGKLTDEAGTLAGAHLTMIDAVRNAIGMMKVSLADALVMASLTPARFLGLEHELGRIAPGYRASLVAFDPAFGIARTWVDGA